MKIPVLFEIGLNIWMRLGKPSDVWFENDEIAQFRTFQLLPRSSKVSKDLPAQNPYHEKSQTLSGKTEFMDLICKKGVFRYYE